MAQYKRLAETVDAVRWFPEGHPQHPNINLVDANDPDALTAIGQLFTIGGKVYYRADQGDMLIPDASWIVTDEDGDVRILDNAQFGRRFIPAIP